MRWSSEWVIRFGDGTEDSRLRLVKAIDNLWMFTGELFMPVMYEQAAAEEGIGVNIISLKEHWIQHVKSVFEEATLSFPKEDIWMQVGGKEGKHTEYMGFILAEMQFLQRAYPGCEW